MARTGIKNTKMVLLRKPFAVNERWMSKLLGLNPRRNTTEEEARPPAPAPAPPSWWVPHPGSGIYFPKGQESVMDDIPNNAASFDRTYWLRSSDGVDHCDDKPDVHAHGTFGLHNLN